MQHEVNPDGTRNMQFRPYIFGEETTYNTVMYNPHESHNHGLYQADHHQFQGYQAHVSSHLNKLTQGVGTHVVPPDQTRQLNGWQKHGGVSAKSSSINHPRMSDQRPYRRLGDL